MNDFVERQWKELCDQVEQSANHQLQIDPSPKQQIEKDLSEFPARNPPNDYKELLAVTGQASEIAVRWREMASKLTAIDS